MSAPLRIALIVDGPEPLAWQAEWITRITALPGVTIARIEFQSRTPSRGTVVVDAYRGLDNALHAGRAAAFRRVPASAIAAPAAPAVGGEDVTLDLSTARAADRGTPPRFGRWWVEWGSCDRLWPAGLAEMVAGEPITTSALVDANAEFTRVIDVAVTATHPYSLAKSRSLTIAAMGALVTKHLSVLATALAKGAGAHAFAKRATEDRAGMSPSPAPPPSLARALPRFADAFGRRVLDRLLVDEFQWSIGIGPRVAGHGPEGHLPGRVRWLAPPAGHFHADPFLVEYQGREALFFEDFDYAVGRGVIACAEVEPDGRLGPSRPALDRPYHLSWPQAFIHDGALHMVPETWGTGRVEHYVCRRFPDQWSLEGTLMDGVDVADPLVFRHENRWWLLGCVAPPPLSPDTLLYAWHAEDLRGPWTPHALNPVVADVRAARPAGRPWQEGGALLRPAQDCSVRYGHGLTVRRIVALDPETFREETVARLGPERTGIAGARGMHTWNTSARHAVVDACVPRLRVLRGRKRNSS